jgi:hypothetical protein
MSTPSAGTAPLLDPHTFDDELLQLLAVLFNQKYIDKSVWLTGSELSRRLRDDHGIGLHWRTIENMLFADKTRVARRRRVRQWQFSILKPGEELLGAAQSSILFIDPAQSFKATLSLHDFFSKLKGTIRVCDAYLDNTTLEHLHALDKSVTIQLLTKNVESSGTLPRLLAAWKTEGRTLEVRVANSAPLHDRYIIDDTAMLILGTSLNGFGKKQCFIIQTGPDVRAALVPVFDNLWNSAVPWP